MEGRGAPALVVFGPLVEGFAFPVFCRCPFPVPLSPLLAAADDDAAADDAGAADEEAAADDAASRFIFARLAAFSSAENSGIVVGVPG